jgi:hypothetical protein
MNFSRQTITALCAMASLVTFTAFAADSLYVSPAGDVGVGTSTPLENLHAIGNIRTDGYFRGQSVNPGFWIDETGTGGKGANVVLDGGVLQFQRRSPDFGGFQASVMRVFIDAPAQSFVLNASGYLGLGVQNPLFPIESFTGARLSAGGVWQNASSRELKENIHDIDAAEAMAAFKELKPVTYNYKVDSEDTYIGFIAEDVPEIVASKDRKTLSSMDMVALLTRVVQDQQVQLAQQKQRMDELETMVRFVAGLKDKDDALAINTK